VDAERIDVRLEPLVVRDGCAPERTPPGRWPSDEPLVRSEQFAVNEVIASLADTGGMFGVHAASGTGVAEVFGDLVAAIVTERARRIADLADPAAAFGEATAWGTHTVTAPAPELVGFEIVLAAPEASSGLARQGPGLPPIGAAWRDRAARADYFASTARLADGVGAWAMLAARLGDQPANRAFADRWWHGTVRGTDVLFPTGESMATALSRLKGTAVYWPACVTWFKSALARVQLLTAERSEAAEALRRLSGLEQDCEETSTAFDTARDTLAELEERTPAARDAASAAEEEYRAVLATLGAHELSRPELTTVTQRGLTALHTRNALSVALAGGLRRSRNLRNWSWARRELRAAAAAAELQWKQTLRAAEALGEQVSAARAASTARAEELAGLTTEMEPLAAAVAAARQMWGDCVPVGPSQAETEDPALIEWRETSAPWADEEYTRARAEAFVAALELHKALIITQADVFEANLAALMELVAAEPDVEDADVINAAWRSFFLVSPVVQVPFDAAGPLLAGLAPAALGWLLAAGADQLPADEVSSLLGCFKRAVFTGDTVMGDGLFTSDTGPAPEPAEAAALPLVPRQPTAQDIADHLVRYGTWLPAGDTPDDEAHWVGTPLRVVRGQDRATVDLRNDLAYDGLLITDHD